MKKIYTIISAVCLITASACSNEKEAIILDELRITPEQLTITKGESSVLEITFSPEDIDDKTIIWKSSNEIVASISPDGHVTGNQAGNAVVSAISHGVMATCNITVIPGPAESLTLDKSELTIVPNESFKLSVTAKPEDVDLSTLIWESSNESVATVELDGTVKGISDGTATISVSSGDISAICDVTVKTMAEVGDFFYSDGTYSSVLDKSKTVIGIVFWTGNPSVHDKLLAKDHPECTNGIVVALTESASKYQPDYAAYCKASDNKCIQDWVDDNLPELQSIRSAGMSRGDMGNMIMGYNNTVAQMAFNADPANAEWPILPMQELLEFRNNNPLPENTSGWYMPSAKELHSLSEGDIDGNIYWESRYMTNLGIVNTALSQVDGASLIGVGVKEYISSTESKTYGSMDFVDFKIKSAVSARSMNYSVSTNRFVFAF